MSNAKTASLPSSPRPLAAALPGSERIDYRGKCRYKTGKCVQERALKTSGVAHNLCDDHRNRQNQHQRKLDAKNRQHKREQRVAANDALVARFAPYPTAAKSIAKRETLTPSSNTSDEDGEAQDTAAAAVVAAGATSAAEAASRPAIDSENSETSLLTSATPSAAVLAAAAASGVMLLPNGPQPPQMTCPLVMQNFDGIVVPLPSYLEGQERIEFRSRIYQKVLDFISEECVARFGAKAEATVGRGDEAQNTQAKGQEHTAARSSKAGIAKTAGVQQSFLAGTKKVGTARFTKRKH